MIAPLVDLTIRPDLEVTRTADALSDVLRSIRLGVEFFGWALYGALGCQFLRDGRGLLADPGLLPK